MQYEKDHPNEIDLVSVLNVINNIPTKELDELINDFQLQLRSKDEEYVRNLRVQGIQ